MENPFITHPRLVSASINQVRVAKLPDVVQDESLVGRSGFELLSTQFLLEKIHRHIVGLRMPRQVLDVLPAFNDCFTHDDPIARISAKQIAVQYGRSLATILLTLKEGHPDNRAARLEWDSSHWDYWRSVKKVWLGGGLMAGKLAPFALAEARRLIALAGHPNFDIEITPNPGSMTLIGAATAVSPTTNLALLLDFGETRIKRGIGFFEYGELKKLHLFSSLPSGCFESLDWGPDDAWAEAQLQHMTAVLRMTWQRAVEVGWTPQKVVAAMACDLEEGQPMLHNQDCYGRLQFITPNLQSYFSELVHELSGGEAPFRLMEDATAAAMVHKGESNTAVLTLGTAVGIGFPDDELVVF